MPRTPLALLAILLATALAACGDGGTADGEAAEVEETILTATLSDDPTDCERLYTQGFLEQMAGGLEGEAALSLCEELVADERGSDPRETTVADVRVDGGEATASVSFVGGTLDGQVVSFVLVDEGDGWKIDRMAEFVEFDRDRLLDGMKREVRELGDFEAELGTCIVERLAGLDDAELQDLSLYNDPDGMQGVVEGCVRGAEGRQDL